MREIDAVLDSNALDALDPSAAISHRQRPADRGTERLTMIKHLVNARFLLLNSALSLLWLSAATAQVTVPGPPGVDRGVDSSMILQSEQMPDRRQQLATPEGRRQAFERSMRDHRASHPELARVLGVDTATVEQVLALLAESEVDAEIRAGRIQPRNLRTLAEEYDQQIRAISKLIGEARLDSYLEYQRTRRARIKVQQFNASLPESSRLSNAQQDRFATLLTDLAEARLAERPLTPLISATPAGSQSSEERWRELQRYQISRTEQQARRMEADTRELLQRLPQILDREQVRAYARREAREVERILEQAQQQRSRAGLGPEVPLDVEDVPAPTLTADTRLQLRVRINGVEINQTLTSKSGGSVSFEGPEGLLMEARPRLYGSSRLVVTLQAYEPTAGAQRPIGRAETSPQITNPQQRLAYPGLGATNRDSLLRGRKAYVLNWDAKVTFL
jgi:hypothetical protein